MSHSWRESNKNLCCVDALQERRKRTSKWPNARINVKKITSAVLFLVWIPCVVDTTQSIHDFIAYLFFHYCHKVVAKASSLITFKLSIRIASHYSLAHTPFETSEILISRELFRINSTTSSSRFQSYHII